MARIGSRSTGGVVRIAVMTGGTGYTSPPIVEVSGGGGTGAAAQARMDGGVVKSIAIVNAGTGYTAAPLVEITGGGGTGAAAVASAYIGPLRPMSFFKGRYNDMYGVDGMGRGIRWDGAASSVQPIGIERPAIGPAITASSSGSAGRVTAVQIVNAGAGYNNVPSVVFAGGTPSTPATAVASIANGRVTGITVNDPGVGYQETPTVSLSGGIGSGVKFDVGVLGRVYGIDITNVGSGYTSNATTAPTLVFSSAQGLTGAVVALSVNDRGQISGGQVISAGTGATTSGVTASVTGGGGADAAVGVRMAYQVASLTASSTGSGYYTPPVITFRPSKTDSLGSGAAATAVVADGSVTGATVYAGGEYYDIPTAVVLDTVAKAQATVSQAMSGKYKCCFRYLDDTPESRNGPNPSSISELVEVDAGDKSTALRWSFSHHNVDARVTAMELWRTTAGQSVLLYRVATIQRSDAEFTDGYDDALSDDDLKNTERDGYALMPVTLPSGQINARRFEVPPGEFAVGVMFQDRAWYAVDTTGARPNSLLYSEIDEPESVPEENELVVQENTGDPDKVVALIPLGSMLVVAQQSHLYRLTYVAQPVLDAALTLAAYRGILNSRCWDVMNGIAFIADGNGLYAFDGQSEEAVSLPVDNYWRDGIIDFSKADQFHVRADLTTKTVRFHYCQPSDAAPLRALCYCLATKAWWEELYDTPVTATCPVVLNGKRVVISGLETGSFSREGGLTDGGEPVPYSLRTGNMALATERGSRSVAVVYRPTTEDATLSLGLHYNNSDTARPNVIASNQGDGFVVESSGANATLNMKRSRSALGDANGFARARFSGKNEERSVGADRHIAVAVSGVQSEDPIVVHGILIEGAE